MTDTKRDSDAVTDLQLNKICADALGILTDGLFPGCRSGLWMPKRGDMAIWCPVEDDFQANSCALWLGERGTLIKTKTMLMFIPDRQEKDYDQTVAYKAEFRSQYLRAICRILHWEYTRDKEDALA